MIDGANINLRREIEQDFQKSTEYIQTSIDQLESDNKSLRTTVNNQEIKLHYRINIIVCLNACWPWRLAVCEIT